MIFSATQVAEPSPSFKAKSTGSRAPQAAGKASAAAGTGQFPLQHYLRRGAVCDLSQRAMKIMAKQIKKCNF